jgi:MFS transporter, UMF1 family
MFSFGYINEFTGSQRSSVLALMIFFIIGLLFLLSTISAKRNSKEILTEPLNDL